MGRWTLHIRFKAGFHVGSGYGFAGDIDRSLLRDADGLPYLPGSSLKGKLRHAARETAEALDEQPCDEYCPPLAGRRSCVICRLFGSPFGEGKLFISDARCDLNENQALGLAGFSAGGAPRVWQVRNGVGIDRRLRTARAGLLFRTEYAPEGVWLKAVVEGELEPKELEVLRAAVKSLAWLGADSSRGLGGCRCQLL